MNVHNLKIVRIMLLVVAIVAGIIGFSKSQEAARDVSKIEIQITNKKSYQNSQNGYYDIDFDYKIKNGTNVDWCYLKFTVEIYNNNGNYLGQITSEIGEPHTSSSFRLKAGGSYNGTFYLEDSLSDSFVYNLYTLDFSKLKFVCKATYGTYIKK